MDSMNFSLVPAEVPVVIDGHPYILREADEAAAKEYDAVGLRGGTLVDGKAAFNAEYLADQGSTLVAACLFKVISKDGEERRLQKVTKSEVMQWPARVVRALYDKATEISGLKSPKKAAQDAKN